MKRRIVALMLSAAMALSLLPSSMAVAAEPEKSPVVHHSGKEVAEVLDSVGSEPVTLSAEEALGDSIEEFTFGIEPNVALAQAMVENSDIEVDENDPTIKALREELEGMTVEQKTLNDDGTVTVSQSGLSDEDIQELVQIFSAYSAQWAMNADALGAQVPYYLGYNDNNDGLGMMGEMFIIAGWKLEDIRAGHFTKDDLAGLILNFYYGDYFGVSNQDDLLGYGKKGGFYRNDIINSRNEVLKMLEDANCTTEAQKLLLINDWIGEHGSFNMPHVMNQGTAAKMLAPEPLQNEHYDEMFATINDFYKDSITAMLKQNIHDGILGDLYANTYDNVYWQLVEGFMGEETAAMYAQVYAQQAYQQAVETDTIPYPVTDDKGNPVIGEDGQPMLMDLPIDVMIEQSMDTPIPSFGNATPNQIIMGGAMEAAAGLTDGVVGIWKSNLVGALSTGNVVCLGYSKAFQYLVQCMHPEVYTKNGQIDNPFDWKSNQELYYNDKGQVDPSKYNVDLVCIEFASDVSMYGIEQDEFNSDHYWNAVKVDGKWYYIDCCYIDVYSEVMIRDQVEADGSMNHLYFLISDTTMREMFDGNFSAIRTLYKDLATDKQYETSWFTRIKNAVGFDGKYIYYLYDSTDMLGMMADYKSDDDNSMQDLMEKQENVSYRLVRHAMDAKDLVPGRDSDGNATNGADSNFETLVYLNYKPQSNNNNGWGNNNNNNQDPVAYYLGKGKTPSNTSINNYTREDSVTKAYADYEDMTNIYASASLAAAYNDGIIYFGVGNAIFAYDIANGTVKCVKQYGVVNMERDTHNEFQGRAYSVTNRNTGIATENAPIAGLQVLDGKLLVSLSSNYSYISGKDEMSDTKEGYTFQESGFNFSYNAFSSDRQEEQAAQYGFSMDRNDNDEFMFSAIAHDSLDFGSLRSGVTYKEINCDHEFFLYRQNYYSLDDAKNFYYGASWICYKCGKNHRASYDDSNNSMMQMMGYGDMNEGLTTEVKDHTIYDIEDLKWEDNVLTFSKLKVKSGITDSTLTSATGKWDYYNELSKIKSIILDKPVAVAATAAFKEGGNCTDGGTLVYTAEGYTSEGFHFEETKEVTVPANTHVFTTKEEENNNNGGFGNWGGNNQEEETSAWTWSNDRKTATIDASKLTCIGCNHTPAEVAKSDTFTMDGLLAGDKLDVTVGEPEAKANAISNGTLSNTTCRQSGSKFYYADGKVTVKVTAAKNEHAHVWDEGTTTAATCEADGSVVKHCTVEGCTATDTTTIKALGHDYGEFEETTPATCTEAGLKTRKCSRCNDIDAVEIPATGHKDQNDDKKCDVCGDFLDHEEVAVTDAKVDATCTEAGKTEGSHCAICGEVITAQEVIPAKGHTLVEIPAVAATCTTEGKTAGKKCSVCGTVTVAPETVDINPDAHDYSDDAEECKLCHKPKTVVAEMSALEASYTVTEGENTIDLGIVVVDCVNDVEAVKGHSWKTPTWEYKTNADENGLFDAITEITMKTACRNCDYVESHAGVFNPSKDVTVKAPTCTQNGSISYKAVAKQSSGKIDSGKYTEVSRTITINPNTDDYKATGHSYDYVWTWADDLKTATLSQVCAVCKNTVKVATVNSTKRDNLDQIEKCETGAILYLATYTVKDPATGEDVELKTSKTVWVPAQEDHPDFFVNREKDDDTGLTWDRTRCVACYQCVEEDLVDFTLVFNANGGKGEMEAQTVAYGVSTPISGNTFTKTGYTFKGWTAYRESDKKWYGQDKNGKKAWVTEDKITDKTYTKVIYKDKAKVAATSSKNNDKIQMYAEWTANKYTIIFEPNGGTGTKMADMTITYGTAKNLTANTYKKTGYTFAGWAAYRESDQKYYGVDKDGNKKWVEQIEITSGWYDLCLYKDKASVAKSTAVNGDKVYLTAQWKANKYNVEFIGNGSTSGSMAKQTITYGVSQKLTANAFKKTGYTFTGWTAYRVSDEKWYAKDSKGNKKWATKSEISSGKWTKVAYADQASVAKSTTKNNDTIKMYAQWKANTYTVKFNANGGTGTMKDMTVTYGTAKALTANAFKKSGKTFKGWYSYRASDKKWYAKDADGNKKWATDEQIKSQNLTKVLTANKASVSKLTSVKGDTVTMYAQWK